MLLSARTQKKRWTIQPADSRSIQLARSLKVSPLLAQILINRGITDAQAGAAFLAPKLTGLIEPEKMPGMEAAIHRVNHAIKNGEKVTVYGDYDVDGITGVSILWQILTLLGANVDYYIPHRIEEGYGLNEDAVRSLAEAGSKLIITVDCGISAFGPARLAEQLGLDIVITDHHQADADLPKAAAVVHPALEKSYGNQDSSGAVVAFKLAWAIANQFSAGKKLQPALREFMLCATSLAAMGTVADIMDLRGENRVLTSYGLKSLPECKLCGIQALIESAGLTGKDIDSFHIGFRLAPMLNAAGRLGHARLAVELLTTASPVRARQIAEYLKDQNSLRQQYERKIVKRACEMIIESGLNHPDRKSIVLAAENWHSGVIGIVASRIVDKFCRPTILISSTKDVSLGSARSVEGFDILSAIRACGDNLVHFGGHKMAAGVTIETGKIPQFAADFENYAKQNLAEDDTVDKLHIDAAVSLDQLGRETVRELQMLGPFGQGNPEPTLATTGVRLISPPRKVGANSNHLQLAITDSTASVSCIGFGMGAFEKKLLERESFNVAYQPQLNTYNGSTNVQLNLTDIQFD